MTVAVQQDLSEIANALAASLPMSTLEPKVVEALKGLPKPWAIACSGGPDSIALLLVLYQHYGPEGIFVLHYNHKVRPEADQEAFFVEELTKSLGMQFIGNNGDPNRKDVSEATLRIERQSFFKAALKSIDSKVILLGHHADDVIETTLMRLTRGSGTSGLCAPRPVNEISAGTVYLRPLLNLRKEQILKALADSGAPWCQDSSNDSDEYFRNRVRNHVVANLENAAKRDISKGFLRSRSLLEEDDEALTFWVDRLVDCKNGFMSTHLLDGKPKALFRRAMHKFLIANDLNDILAASALDAFIENIYKCNPIRVSIGDDRWLTFDGKAVALIYQQEASHWSSVRLEDGKTVELPGGGKLEVVFVELDDALRAKIMAGGFSEDQCVFLASAKANGFIARQWESGDRYIPLGAPGSRKLQDVFVDKKIPASARKDLPVIENEDGSIAWCPGLPVGDKFKVTSQSRHALRLTYCVNNLKIRHYEYE